MSWGESSVSKVLVNKRICVHSPEFTLWVEAGGHDEYMLLIPEVGKQRTFKHT